MASRRVASNTSRDENRLVLTRPLLLIDVDGVLNPYLGASDVVPEGYGAHRLGGMSVVLCASHGRWLHELAALFDLVWASTWEADAEALIGPTIGAPAGIPHLTFSERDPEDWTWKLPAVERHVGDRPVAWLDDDPGHGAADWAATRAAPTLLIRPSPRVGWTRAERDQLVAFATALLAG